MNDVQRGLALLMKSAITGEACALPETFSMEKASDTIKRHKIATLAYDGAIRCGIERNLPEMQRLFQEYCRIMLHSEGQLRAVTEICRAFDENGIDYMPLKGCNLKRIYPKPELRQMGDADILVRKEQYARIRPILRSMGFEEGMESDHEWAWHRKDLYLELHRRLIPSYNEDYYAYFGDGWRLAKCSQGTRYALSREDEFIFIFTHFAKHFRDGGAGCRYVLDLPPVTAVTDALVASKLVEGVIVVVRSDYSDRGSLNETLRQVKLVNGRVLGFVLTCSNGSSSGYGRKYRYGRRYHKYGYEYGYKE